MWFLIEEPDKVESPLGFNTRTSIWALKPGETYTVGRQSSSNICPSEDKSVSNSHAKITVVKKQKSALASQGVTRSAGSTLSMIRQCAEERPEVILEDLKSSYGTFINDASWDPAIKPGDSLKGAGGRGLSKPTILKDNDRIKFGAFKFVFRLKWLEFEVTKSMLKDLRLITSWLRQLGTQLVPSWSPATTHLVMSNIELSSKVLYCLATGTPIVTPLYFRDIISAMNTKQRLPDPDNYVPEVSPNESEALLRTSRVSMKMDLSRSKLFKGKTFMCLGEAQRAEAGKACELAGGEVKLWDPSKMKKEMLDSPDILLLRPRRGKTQDMEQGFSTILAYLESIGRTSVMINNIYLAIVHCDIQHCSNQRSKTNILPPEGPSEKTFRKIHAPDTQVFQDTGTSGGSVVSISSQLTSNPPESDDNLPSKPSQPSMRLRTKRTQVIPAPSNSQTETDIFKTPGKETSQSHRNLEFSQGESTGIGLQSIQTPVEMDNYLVSSNIQEKKRARSSSDVDEPAAKKPWNPAVDEEEVFIDRPVPTSQTSSQQKQTSLTNSQGFQRSQRLQKETEEDIFGFEEDEKEAPRRRATATSTVSQRKRKLSDEDEDDLFQFGDEDEFVKKSRRAGGDTQTISSPEGKENKLKIPEGKENKLKVIQPVSAKQDANQSLSTQNTTTGFLSKSCARIKEEPPEDGDMSKLSDDLCTILVVKLFRDTQPIPREEETIVSDNSNDSKLSSQKGRKCFKKQKIYRCADKINLSKCQEPDGDQSITNWLQQNPDITTSIQEEERIQQDAEDFWTFNESQTQKSSRNKRGR